jgi:hypothetical protein
MLVLAPFFIWLIMGISFGPFFLLFIFLGKKKTLYEKETDQEKSRDQDS